MHSSILFSLLRYLLSPTRTYSLTQHTHPESISPEEGVDLYQEEEEEEEVIY
jgi:hypothetical protein